MRTKKAAIYARVNQNCGEHGLEYQRVSCQKTIGQRGWKQRGVYLDVASGNDSGRPGSRQLLSDARTGRFKALVITGFDRLTRNSSTGVKIIKALKKLGIEIVFTASKGEK